MVLLTNQPYITVAKPPPIKPSHVFLGESWNFKEKKE